MHRTPDATSRLTRASYRRALQALRLGATRVKYELHFGHDLCCLHVVRRDHLGSAVH